MKYKHNCLGCAALAKQNSILPGQWNDGCKLNYKNEIRDAGFVYPVPVPLEICSKPKTIKAFQELKK